ncbi:MAG: hypothetical protein IVW53_13810 [Chloroflexi bacterium]|nr:hypothetical protein [Chloroflexota bacterium]
MPVTAAADGAAADGAAADGAAADGAAADGAAVGAAEPEQAAKSKPTSVAVAATVSSPE